jgi:beta-galactosidase/beta-glucuronidase
MKKLIWIILVITGCSSYHTGITDKISLTGEWKFSIDSLDQGIKDGWYNKMAEETITLPGSMAENGKGNKVTLKTDWTGDIVDRSYFTDKKYAKYREPGNIKIPFWLKPVKYYKGVAWYQKEFELPQSWDSKEIILFLERPHWETTVFINGKKTGSENSLAVPHQYDITDLITTGKNQISIRIDNRVVIPVGVNSHSITDHTQTNWNGIIGEISLRATPRVFISDIRVYPDISKKSAKVIVAIKNKSGNPFKGKVIMHVESVNTETRQVLKSKVIKLNDTSDELQLIVDYPMGRRMKLWSEFHPDLYRLIVSLEGSKDKVESYESVDFGMREFKTKGTRFIINNHLTFLRGTLECCIFPLTGYPPTDIEGIA